MFTIDASVLVAANTPDEVAHASARAFLQRALASGAAVHQPTLAVVEVTAGIARRTGDPAHARAVGVQSLGLPGLVLHDLDGDAALVAAGLASDLGLRAAEAVYAATALVHGTVLVTLDVELATRASTVIEAHTPAGWLELQGERRTNDD